MTVAVRDARLSSESCRAPPVRSSSRSTGSSARASSPGADEAGRGSLAGPLVVAGVLLDYECLRNHRVRPLALLNDSKQVSPAEREELFRAVVGCATRISVRVIPAGEIDRNGLHRSNLWGLRSVLADLAPPAEACLVDGFRLGPAAPEHRAVVDGDTKSAAIAAASIVAKVTRDRVMRRLDALYPRYGFASPRRLHHARPLGRRARARPERAAPALVQRARAIAARARRATADERRAARHYRLRGYRILGANVWAGGYELDLIVRRGRRLVFCEVKGKTGGGFGDPLEMVDDGEAAAAAPGRRGLARAAIPTCRALDCRFEVVAVRAGQLERVAV